MCWRYASGMDLASGQGGRVANFQDPSANTFFSFSSPLSPLCRFGPYFIEPVVAGLPAPSSIDPEPKPFIATMDT